MFEQYPCQLSCSGCAWRKLENLEMHMERTQKPKALDEVFIHVDPTVGKRNKGTSDQEVSVGNLNKMDEENVGWPKPTWGRVGNKVLVYILKRSDAEERQMDGRIRILKKRDNYNRDDMGINFKRILKKRDNYNMDWMERTTLEF